MIEAWTLRPGMVIAVPGMGTKMIMDVAHRPRFNDVLVTFDDGFSVKIMPSALIRTL